jgi:periplasmic protein TonB
MFESIRQETEEGSMKYFASLMVSLAVHAVIICALVVVPLVFFNVLQAHELLTFLIEPPQPPPAPPAPTPPVAAAAARHGGVIVEYGAPPKEIPTGIPPADDTDPIVFDATRALLQIPGVEGSGQTGGIGKGIIGLTNEPPKLEAPEKPKPRQPIRVASLEQSKLVYKVNPVYPPLAARAHVQGNVILEAVVDEEGNVSTLKVLGGHPLLVDAALQAVRQWKYSPTVLNGEPVPIIATVTVVFRLTQ